MNAEPAQNLARRSAHQEFQRALARLFPDTQQIVVEGSGHFIHRERPDVVIGALRRLHEQVKTNLDAH